MITFRTYLTEVGNRPLPYTWSTITFGGRRASFTTEHGVRYTVFIMKYDPSPQWPIDTLPAWEVIFENFSHDDGHAITGTGMSLQVFSTVVAIMQDAVRLIQPVQFYFTAKEVSRQRLYRRFAQQVGRYFPGWTVETRPAGRGNPVETYWFVDER